MSMLRARTLGRRGLRSGYRSTGASTPAVLIASKLVERGYTVRGAFSRSERLYDNYSGPLIRVRRSGDNTQLDIGFDPETNLLDVAALAAHCTTNNGFVTIVYNQDGSGNDLPQSASTARQPKIYDGATGTFVAGGLAVSEHVSTANTDGDTFDSQTHQLGFDPTKSPDITIYASGLHTDITAYRRNWLGLGGTTGVDNSFTMGFADTGNYAVGSHYLNFGGTNQRREFTPASAVSDFHYVITSHVSKAYTNSITLRQNGVLLSQAAVYAGQRDELSGSETTIGATIGATSMGIDGRTSTEIFIEGIVDGDGLADLATFGDAQLTAAGETPVAHDLTNSRPFAVLVAGQSNAEGTPVPGTAPNDNGPHWVGKVAAGGTGLSPYWVSGGAQHTALMAALAAIHTDVPLVIWFIQGETDAGNVTLAANYLTNLTSLYNDAVAAYGGPIYWLDTLLHEDLGGTYKADVNAAKTTFSTSLGQYGILIDPSTHGELEDGVHWDPALDTAMCLVAVSAIRAVLYP